MMNNSTLLAFPVLAALLVAGCASREEKLCQASVRETLLNPETAEFSAFAPIDAKQMAEDEMLSFTKKLMADQLPDQQSHYQMRIRAEGQLGNKITEVKLCGINTSKDRCVCI
jgi:outer membrane murein-binding lipoprotein Lpp